MASIDRTELLRHYEALGPALTLYARTWLDAAAAADVVQDAFVALFTRGRDVENARAWLYTAVRNRAVEVSRSRRRRERRERRAVRGGRGWGPGLLAEDAGTLMDAGSVAGALEALGVDEREIVVLRVWGEMTFEEVGAICGVSGATAFRKYRGALESIRKKLEKPCTRQRT